MQLLNIFKTDPPVSSDFDCPYGVPWRDVKSSLPPIPNLVLSKRPPTTFNQMKSFARAITMGKYVSKEILEERVAICGKCKYRRVDPQGFEWCGVCGCKTSAEDRKINNLAAYEEGPVQPDGRPLWGCKHPRRKRFGWKR
jgi:hypothetical protein